MAPPVMTVAELIAELNAAVTSRDGFYTTEEWGALLDRKPQAVRVRLKAAKQAGRLEIKRVPGVDQRGIPCTNTVYRILPAD